MKTFDPEVCPEACAASSLGVLWDPAELKLGATWSDLRVDPAWIWKLALENFQCPFLRSAMLQLCKIKLIKYCIYPYQSKNGAKCCFLYNVLFAEKQIMLYVLTLVFSF